MAATAPTFAAQGTASFCAPAKLKVLLVPGSPLDTAEFEKWVSYVRNFDCFRLRDVPRTKASVFPSSPLYQQGEVHVSFMTSYDPSHAFLSPLQLSRQVHAVLALTTYDTRSPLSSQDLPRVAGILRNEHSNALVHRVFAFEVSPLNEGRKSLGEDGDLGVATEDSSPEFQPPAHQAAAGFGGRRDDGLFVFPAIRKDAKDVRFYLRTQLAELVGETLDRLDTLVTALEGTPLETPRETLTDVVSPALRSAMSQQSETGTSHTSSPTSNSALVARNSLPTPSASSSGAASKMFGALSKRRSSTAPTSGPVPSAGPLGITRRTKLRADLALLSGDLWLALDLYDSLLTVQNREKALAGGQDAVWFASALEGWAVARMLVARLGGAAHDEAPCLAYTLHQAKEKDKDKDRDREVREPAIPALAWKDIAEAYALALAVYSKCLAPPQFQQDALRSVTNDTPRDYTPPLVHASACLAYARFLLAIYASGGWNAEAFDQMLFGGVPPPLAVYPPPSHTELSANSGVYRDEIASAACATLTPALGTLSASDQIAILSAISKILSLIGYLRRFTHVVRQLNEVVFAVLARSFQAKPQAAGSAPSIDNLMQEALRNRIPTKDSNFEASLDFVGIHDAANPALVLGLLACDTYGIDLLTCPIVNVSSSHILERARRRIVAERYASFLDSKIRSPLAEMRSILPALAVSAEAAQLQKTAFGWTSLQVQLLKDLVVQSEALADHVSMVYFASLLLRDFQELLSLEDHAALLAGLRRVIPLARKRQPSLKLRYWGPKQLLVALEVLPQPSVRATINRTRTSFDPPKPADDSHLPPGTSNPFYWNSGKSEKSQSTPTFVAQETCTVLVTLQNPLGVPLPIECISLAIAGLPVETKVTSVTVPARALHTIRMEFVPLESGTLTINGCHVELWCAESRMLAIASKSKSQDALGKDTVNSKATGLNKRHSIALLTTIVNAAAARAENSSKAADDRTLTGEDVDQLLFASDRTMSAECKVTEPMPLMEASFSPAYGMVTTLQDGEEMILPIRLINRSMQKVSFIRFEFEDNLQRPKRAAIANEELLAGDVNELEWQLLYQPVLQVDADVRNLQLMPNASCIVPLKVRGKQYCTWANVKIFYGTPPADRSMICLRTTQISLPMSVLPSITCEALTFHSAQTQNAENLAAVLKQTSSVQLGPSCLIGLDLRNNTSRLMTAIVNADAAPNVSIEIRQNVLPSSSIRITVPMAKQNLSSEELNKPIPKLSPRQFVVARTVLSDAMQSAYNAQFWLRDALLRSLDVRWEDCVSAATGQVSLRDHWPSMDDVRIYSRPKVQINLHMPETHIHPETMVDLRVEVTNLTEAPLRLRLQIHPMAETDLGEGRAASYVASQILLAEGSWSQAVHPSPLQPNDTAYLRKTLCFLSSGAFSLHATAEVLSDIPESPSVVFPSTPLSVYVA
ncbi:hypothetical protein MPSI1_000277 [Malassezia psittaci]|uniref:Uncharacterized protein n=1 Tax=Malassezia psittaci TaxID=1821823 RepID=A0AAF0F6B1_9BASI|nr:hypothetical protein MPSI1_000277 [Malassezia psittaci]